MKKNKKDLIISMVKEEIETNPQYEPYRRELTFDSINNTCFGSLRFNVFFRFKPVGRGRKDNVIRFDIFLDREFKEKIIFVYTNFESKNKM